MTRRSFLRSVIVGTLAAPFVTRQVRAYPLSEGVTAAIYDSDWNGEYRVSLWDGDHFIKVVNPQYLGRAVIVPTWTREGTIAETSFKITSAKMDEHGLHTIKAHYEYGPKWWKVRQRVDSESGLAMRYQHGKWYRGPVR